VLIRQIGAASFVVWNSEMVVYHHESGDTYLLPEIQNQVASYCLAHDLISSQVSSKQTPLFLNDRAVQETSLQKLLDQLVQIGLISIEAL
jgi:hypothetical protein